MPVPDPPWSVRLSNHAQDLDEDGHLPADEVLITDAGDYYVGDTVEEALQEIGAGGIGGGGMAERPVVQHGSMGSTETLTFAAEPDDDTTPTVGPDHAGTLSANLTLTLAGATNGERAQIDWRVVQDGTGGRTITFPGSVVWPSGIAPTLTTTAGAVEWISFVSDDGGTTWYGFHNSIGSAVGDLDDLSDVAITSPQENDTLRYVSGQWVNDDRRWEPVTFNFGSGPELVWDGDDLVMEWKEY